MWIRKQFSVRHLLLLAGFLVASFLSVTMGQAQHSAAHADPVATKIMVVGDSISHGGAGDWTWRYRLWQHLTNNGALTNYVDFVGPFNTVHDYATNSNGSHAYLEPNFDNAHDATAGRAILDEKNVIAQYVSTYTPDILIINMGTNDLGPFYGNRSAQQAENDLRQLISNARSAKSNVKIVLSKITQLVFADSEYQARWAEYNNRLVTVASSMNSQASPIVLADPVTGYNSAVDDWDGVHPAPSGEFKFAAAYANALFNSFGIGSPYGPIPSAPAWPLATTAVQAVPGDRAVTLTWSPVAGAFKYHVYMRQVGGGSYTQLTSKPIEALTFIAGPLTNGVAYEFAISTVREYVTGPQSMPVQAIPVPRTRPPSPTPQFPRPPSRPIPTTPPTPLPSTRQRTASTNYSTSVDFPTRTRVR